MPNVGVTEGERPALQAVDADERDVVLGVERDDLAGGAGPLPAIDDGRGDAGDDVRVRDDEPAAHDPAGALDAEPACNPLHAHDRVARGAHRRHAGDRRVRLADVDVGTGERRERVDPPDRVHDPLRGDRLGERGDDCRLLREPAELALAGDVEEDGADRPDERQPGKGAEHDAAGRVDHAEGRHDRERLTGRGADEQPRHLPDHPAERGGEERHQWDVAAQVADELRAPPRRRRPPRRRVRRATAPPRRSPAAPRRTP